MPKVYVNVNITKTIVFTFGFLYFLNFVLCVLYYAEYFMPSLILPVIISLAPSFMVQEDYYKLIKFPYFIGKYFI